MKQPNEISNRVFAMFAVVCLAMLATCSPKKTEAPAAQTQSAFIEIDQATLDSVPPVLQDTSAVFTRTRFARVNPSFFEEERKLITDSTLTLQLFNDVSVNLIIESIIPGEDSTEVWTLHSDNPYYGTATIILSAGAVYARIQIHTTVYEVFPVGKNIVRIREIDQTKFPQEAPPIEKKANAKTQIVKTLRDSNTITVLVVAPTPVYSVYCSNILGIDIKKILEAAYTDNLKKVFNNMQSTGVNAVVKFACYPYKPVGGDLTTDLTWVSSNSGVAALRDQYKADLVCLLVPDATVCGRGYVNYPVESSDADRGFCVVRTSCAIDNFSFAHELGHNMGMRHDRETDGAYSSATCNYGSVFKIKVKQPFNLTFTARSVMTYGSACNDCPRLGLYSNPMKKTIGIIEYGPMGVACDAPAINQKYYRANNRQQLIDAAPIVSNFR